MNILAISDEESKSLWDYYSSNPIKNVDLIISSGDLKSEYLSFLATMTNLPVLYVHGNHDEHYDTKKPEGCICIDDKIYVHNGIRILGLGGCLPYRDGKYMYSEREMKFRIMKLKFALKKYDGFDILVTHAPVKGVGEGSDPAHQGYEAFLPLLEQYKPKYMIHGHVHKSYSYTVKRTQDFNGTTIINASEKYLFEY